MLRNLNVTTGGRRILGVPDVGILAATIASQTASGTNGPGLLYDEAINPANAGKQLRLAITSLPGSGTLFVYENGAFDLDGAANGTYSIGYDWYADDVLGGSDTATVVVGAADGAAAGATLTGTAALTAGSASGNSAGTAPGATLTGTASLSSGSASGGSGVVDGSAPGATLTGAGVLNAGSAGELVLSDADVARIADAVWARLIESGFSAEQLLRIIAAALAGTSEKAGSTITFKGVDGATDRIIGSFDADNNRTGAILNGG